MKHVVLLVFFSFLCFSSRYISPLGAQELSSPQVRAEIEPSGVAPGQPLRLRVTVLVPTWFVKPPVYPSFELPNAVTRLPPNSSFNVNERIAGQNWSGIVRDYVIYPQVAARYELTGQEVLVRFADPATNEPVVEAVTIPAVAFSARLPQGAENLSPFLAGKTLSLEQTISPAGETLQAGDAIERRVTATINGTPAMFLPPLLSTPADNGLKFYPREPRIADRPGTRGDTIAGTREETALYVFERGGSYRLPEVNLRWWNSDSRMIETTSLPEITIDVKPGAGASQDRPSADTTGSGKWILIAGSLFVFFLAGLLGWRYPQYLKIWMRRQLERRRATESYAFRKVMHDLQRGPGDPKDVGDLYKSLQCWLERLLPGIPLETFLRTQEGAKLAPYLQALGRSVYGPASSSASPLDTSNQQALRAELRAARNAVLLQEKKKHRGQRLVPLYPRPNRGAEGQ